MKSSKERVAKWRSQLSKDDKEQIREKDSQQKRNQRMGRTEAQKDMDKMKDKANKALKRSSMTEEEKERIRE